MSFASRLSQRIPMSLLIVGVLLSLIPQLASAQTLLAPTPSLEPLDIKLLESDTLPAGQDIVTANTISQTGITNPSLWWAKEQFNEVGGKLINNWIAYQDKKRVDLIVNSQPWTLLDYLGRYRFVNKFGTVARDYAYNVRVFNPQGTILASYTCDYSKTPSDCGIIIFNSFGQDSLPVPRSQP
jgi:hypothetical protein